MTRSAIPDAVGAFVPGPQTYLEGASSGVLSGLTFAVKDVFDLPGRTTGFGQPTWLATHAAATRPAATVSALLDAGATLVGSTVCDELCYSLTGENSHYGTPINVNATDRVAGGSSSGSAAAVAAGLVDFALGTDCGGSVRIPASYCGIFGLRPTHDRISTDGVLPFAPPFDVVGWLASDAQTFAKVSEVMLKDDLDRPETKIRRLLLPIEVWQGVTGPIADALVGPLASVETSFEVVDRIRLSEEGLDAWAEAFRVLQAAAVWETLGPWVLKAQPQFGPGIAERFAAAAEIRSDDLKSAMVLRDRVRSRLDDLLGDDGVLCLPTAPHVAPLRGAPLDEVELAARGGAMRLLCTAGLCGLPQVSIPAATTDGNPVGISFVAPRGADLAIVGLASALTGDAPW